MGASLDGPQILVIDDSSTIRRSAEIFLTQAGYPVILSEDGFEALGMIVERQPALVFCDILMPRLDGFQTCALIRHSKRCSHIPVVMLSSRDGLFDRAHRIKGRSGMFFQQIFHLFLANTMFAGACAFHCE